jgi:hypothetical protein
MQGQTHTISKPQDNYPRWWGIVKTAVWTAGIAFFILVVLLLINQPPGISKILDYRWMLWLVGVVVLLGVIVLRFIKAWIEPVPAAATVQANEKEGPVAARDGITSGQPVLPERFFSWLFAYPFFPLQIVMFWAVSWLGFGEGLGLSDLVWEDSWWPRFFAGLSVSLLFGNALFVRAILDRRPGNRPPDLGSRPSLFWFIKNDDVQRVGAFLLWTWIPALAMFYFPKMFAWTDWKEMGESGSMFKGLSCGVIITVLTGAFYRYCWQGSRIDRLMLSLMPAFHGKDPLPMSKWPLHSLAGLITILLPVVCVALFLLEHLFFDAVWSPVWLLCMSMALFNSIYGFVIFQLSGLQYMLALSAAMIVYVSNTQYPDKMTFPGLEDYQAKGVKLNDPPPNTPKDELDLIETPTLLKAFHEEKWAQGVGKGQTPLEFRKPKLVIIATTGGGIQAAVWTGVVLEGLEKEIPGKDQQQAAFRDHIRLITGASGGMQAAALYATDFVNPMSNALLSTQLARDSLWPTIQTMLAHDLTGLAWPKQFGSDRGRTLERAWEWNCQPWKDAQGKACEPPDIFERLIESPKIDSPLAKTFWDIREEEKKCNRPSLIFSPMLVEDCRRVLISNLDLEWFTATTASNLNPSVVDFKVKNPNLISIPALEMWRYFPAARQKFKVCTAARMSATFPFVGPAVSLPSDPPRRVVDAGYFDNFGINLAAMWLYRFREEIKKHTDGVVIVEVRAYKRSEEKLRFEMGTEGEKKAELFTWATAELSSPLEAIINLYARGAYFRNDQLLHILDRELNTGAPPGKKFFTTVAFECGQPAALSWTLPKQDEMNIRNQFYAEDGTLHVDVKDQVAALKTWFGDGGSRP